MQGVANLQNLQYLDSSRSEMELPSATGFRLVWACNTSAEGSPQEVCTPTRHEPYRPYYSTTKSRAASDRTGLEMSSTDA